MKVAKSVCLFVVFVAILLSNSCSEGEKKMQFEVSPDDKSLVELVSEIYDKSQLLELTQVDFTIYEMNARYPIECIREKNGIYRVSYLGIDSIAVLLYDEFGNRLLANVYSATLVEDDFDEVLKGGQVNDVRKIDPNGEYFFLYTGKNDTPKISSHYTKDGYLITIEYDVTHTIVNIKKELI